MSKVGQKEILTQKHVIRFFQDEIGYNYLDQWKDRPDNSNDEQHDKFTITFPYQTPQVTTQVTPEVTPEVRILKALKGEMDRQSLQSALGLKDDEHFRKAYLLPAIKAGLIEMTIPEKPRSSKQKYRLTEQGRELEPDTGVES